MRLRLAFLAVLLGAFTAHGQVFGRWNKNDEGVGKTKNPILLSLSLLPPDSECSGTPPDGVTFTRASDATCIRSDGIAVALASNQARVHSTLGLLVEGSATNAVLHSRNVCTAPWDNGGASCAVTGVGMDGVTPVGRGSGGSQEFAVAAGTRTVSAYVKQASGSTCSASLSVMAGATTGAVALTGVWQRLALTYTATAGVNGVDIESLGDGCTIDIDYVQDEAGSIATSPIVTGGTAAVRATENPRIEPQGEGFLTSGCVALDLTPSGWSDPTLTFSGPYLLGTEIDNTNSRMLYVLPGTSEIRNYDGTRLASYAVTFSDGVASRYISRWGNGSMSVCAQGVGCSDDTLGFTGFPGSGNLVLGANSNSASTNNRAHGHLRNLVLGRTPEACQ